VSATKVCTYMSDDRQFRCAHVLLGLRPGKIKFGRLVPTLLHATGSFLEMFQGPKSYFCSYKWELIFRSLGKVTCTLKNQVFWDVMPWLNVSMMKALKSLKKSINIHQSTWHNIPLEPTH